MKILDSAINDNVSILFIDTKLDTLINLNRYFNRYYNCYFANTGNSGLTLFKNKKPNMVICNTRLPDTSSFDLCRQFKRTNQELCFIFLSTHNDKATRIKGLECLADTFIDKNLDDYEIFLRIRNLHPYQTVSNALGNTNTIYIAEENTQSIKTRLYELFSQHYSTSNTTKVNINLREVSKELALSVRSMQRKLKQETDLSFTQHHLLFRLEKAE